MKPTSRLRLPGALLSLLVCAAAAFGQQSVAPPTPQPDPLTAPVTLATQAQTLQELLPSLQPKTGPRLQVSEPLRWERVSVFTRRQPLQKVMHGLQALLNYTWLTDPDKPPFTHYLFASSEWEHRYEQDLWLKTLERGAAPLFELTRYLNTSQEDYARLEEKLRQQHKDPEDSLLRDNLFYLARSGPRLGLRLLTTLTPEQRLTLLENGRLVLTQAEMTEQQKQLTHGLGQAIGEFRQRWGRVLPAEKPEDSAALADQLGIILDVVQHPVSGAVNMYCYGLGEGGMVAASLPDTNAPEDLLPVRGNPYHYNPVHKATLPSYPTLERMPFPADFKFSGNHFKAWREVVAELAKHMSLPIFSDDYAFTPDPRDRQYYRSYPDADEKLPRADPPQLRHKSLVAGLDALCNQYRYLWWYENGMLFFRSRTWFIERQYEVPPPVLVLLQQHLQKNNGKYDVACLTALSTLTLRQLQCLNVMNSVGQVRIDRDMSIGQAKYTYGYLQVISLLDETQKAKVLSPTGLPLVEMTPSQQQAFVQMLFMTRGPEILNQLPNIWLKAEQPDWDVSANPQAQHVPVMYFTYKEHDAAIARVEMSYQSVTDEQDR